ncbi:MAG: anti-sigma factor [Acidimicrobiaceae bacterium]|nr:anti-sigma factor [Acidimicrobiaceae bacterium]
MSDDVHHLAAAYTLDALDPDERAMFEAHLDDCERCRVEVAEFGEVAGSLAGAAATTPPPAMRDRVLAEIAETRQDRPTVRHLAETRRRPRSAMLLATAAAIVGLIAGAAIALVAFDRTSDSEVVLSAPDAITMPLDGAEGSVRVVWSSELGRAVVLGDGLPDPGADRVYELWSIGDDGPVPAGLFSPDDGRVQTVFDLDPNATTPAAWGITNEPDGGSPAPTGDILYFAEV